MTKPHSDGMSDVAGRFFEWGWSSGTTLPLCPLFRMCYTLARLCHQSTVRWMSLHTHHTSLHTDPHMYMHMHMHMEGGAQ